MAVAVRSRYLWFGLSGFFLLLSVMSYLRERRSPSPVPLVAGTSLPQQTPSPSATSMPARDTVTGDSERRPQLRDLVNADLNVSSSLRNIGVLIDMPTGPVGLSPQQTLYGFLRHDRVRFIPNVASDRLFRSPALFEELYSGNKKVLAEVAALSKVDYILVGKLTCSFRGGQVDEELITCDMALSFKLADRTGTVLRSDALSATGPGFTQAAAVERSAENLSKQLVERAVNPLF